MMLEFFLSIWLAASFAYLLFLKAQREINKQLTRSAAADTSAPPSSQSDKQRLTSRRLTLQLWSADLVAASVAGFVLWGIVSLLMRIPPLWQFLPGWLEWLEWFSTGDWLLVPAAFGAVGLGVATALLFVLKVPKKEEYKAVLPGEPTAQRWQLATDFWVFGLMLAGAVVVGIVIWQVGAVAVRTVSLFEDSWPHLEHTGSQCGSTGTEFLVPIDSACGKRISRLKTPVTLTLALDCRANGLPPGCTAISPLAAIDTLRFETGRMDLVDGPKYENGLETATWRLEAWTVGHLNLSLFGVTKGGRLINGRYFIKYD